MSRVSQARNLGKYFLLIDNMLVVLGFFVVFPLISIRFVDQMGWAAVMVGIALGLRQFIQQGLGIFGGAIADRFGAKPMIVTGMLMRAAGFATMVENYQDAFGRITSNTVVSEMIEKVSGPNKGE